MLDEREVLAERTAPTDVEAMARKLHDIYQETAKAQDDQRHPDPYDELPEHIKEYDRAIARYVLGVLAARTKALLVYADPKNWHKDDMNMFAVFSGPDGEDYGRPTLRATRALADTVGGPQEESGA